MKDILAYLQLVDNPAFLPAFTRVVNTPSRMVGEKVCGLESLRTRRLCSTLIGMLQTVNELLHQAKQLGVSPMELVERIVDGKVPDIKPPVKKKLAAFAGMIRDLRKYANEVSCQSPPNDRLD